MFIPGMLPISFWFARFVCAVDFFRLDAPFRRCNPDIFIPGMLIRGMLLMSCLWAVGFLRVAFLFFRDVALELALGFDLLIPGMLDMSCCARTGKQTTSSISVNKNMHLTRELNLNELMLFIISPRKVPDQRRTVKRLTSSAGTKESVVLVKLTGRVSGINLKHLGGD
jgi:hypothetical protein